MQMLHGIACRVRNPRGTAEVVRVVPIGFAGVLLMVGKGGEVGKLRGGIRDGGVERQHEAVGAVHLAVGRRGVRHGRGQRGEFAATNLQGDSLLDYL